MSDGYERLAKEMDRLWSSVNASREKREELLAAMATLTERLDHVVTPEDCSKSRRACLATITQAIEQTVAKATKVIHDARPDRKPYTVAQILGGIGVLAIGGITSLTGIIVIFSKLYEGVRGLWPDNGV